MKVGRADAFADDVPIAAAFDVELLRVHDVFELLSNFTHLLHGFRVNEVIAAPVLRVSVRQKETMDCWVTRFIHSHTYPLFFHCM